MTAAWQDRALCVGEDPDLWFDGKRRDHAMRICAMCPVATECRESGNNFSAYRGVWGGEIRRATAPGPSPSLDYISQHGTNAGYQAHMRDRTPPCERCSTAHTFYRRDRDQRRTA